MTRHLMASTVALLFMACSQLSPAAPPTRNEVLTAMQRATAFMTDKAAYNGGYCSNYLPDFSRRWGEMESTPTQIWIQNPATPLMGQSFLDAYHVTGDERYYTAAANAARALIAVQHPAGGWNYLADFAGEEALKKWYETTGKNAWRLEEYQHYYGNATFDDDTTHDTARFLLRMAREKNDPAITAAFDKALEFILRSQYKNGGWPQRYPLMSGFSKDGLPDYTGCITYNDAVCSDNIDFLLEVYAFNGDEKLLDPIRRGMDCFLLTVGKPPQPAWGLQHDPETFGPVAARTYEPRAYVTSTTASNIALLLRFYRLTGDRKYLGPIPAALDWLDAVKLPAGLASRGTHPTFVEVGTNKPLYIHRRGSNAINGHYYVDESPDNTIAHYSSFRRLNTGALRQRYEQVAKMTPEEAMKDSPLRAGTPRTTLPRFVTLRAPEPNPFIIPPISSNPANSTTEPAGRAGLSVEARAARVIAELSPAGYWPTPFRFNSHTFHGDGPVAVTPGDFVRTMVGDDFDTSPYRDDPVDCIAVSSFVANMASLMRCLEGAK